MANSFTSIALCILAKIGLLNRAGLSQENKIHTIIDDLLISCHEVNLYIYIYIYIYPRAVKRQGVFENRYSNTKQKYRNTIKYFLRFLTPVISPMCKLQNDICNTTIVIVNH